MKKIKFLLLVFLCLLLFSCKDNTLREEANNDAYNAATIEKVIAIKNDSLESHLCFYDTNLNNFNEDSDDIIYNLIKKIEYVETESPNENAKYKATFGTGTDIDIYFYENVNVIEINCVKDAHFFTVSKSRYYLINEEDFSIILGQINDLLK